MDKKLEELVGLIDEPYQSACLKILHDHKERIYEAPGSSVKHQAFKGGYVGHMQEIMNLASMLFREMNTIRPLDFSLSDALLILFLHDLEKPFKYVEPKTRFKDQKEKDDFVLDLIKKYDLNLTENHLNALKYVHGEGDDYSKTERIQKPLAAFVHVCDTLSARVWFEYPKNK